MGRVRVTAERRAEVVAEFRRSGLSGCRFARLAGVRYSTLMGWVQRATQEGPGPSEGTHRMKARPFKLVEAVVDRAVVKAQLKFPGNLLKFTETFRGSGGKLEPRTGEAVLS